MSTATYLGKRAGAGMGKLNDTLSIVLTIAIVVVVGVVLWNIFKAAKTGSKVVGDTLGDTLIGTQTGIPTARVSAIRSIAQEAHDAIWGEKISILSNPISGWFTNWGRIDENEDAFIAAANKLISTAEARLFSEFYKQIGGHSAKSDVAQYLDTADRSRINSTILNAIS